MAKTKGVWGIDIGQSALKALRCHVDEDGNVVADSYDFIEYPKALSLPDADEEALVSDALDTFLGRNEVRGDFVAMTVSGQSGLSRFFKPPPVDARTLPEIVRYEVRQQIPFPIDDVIWDWQSLGGTKMDNILVDAEVGLFAIKRDTVYAALQPFLKKDIEVDLIQLSPLASHNVVCHELLGDIPEGEEIDVDNMPDSVVILSMGTDATDLIITNGIKLWLRNIPIGGNHFTKELSRELKLTQAKAEHLKRNARQAEDPKTVFQAMRRVFNDLKKEIDRSLAFYSGMDKNATLEKIVLLGNAARLPGLRQYLTKQLDMDIAKVSSFDRLEGPVTEERVFKENVLSFAPVYGLCLQGLKQARLDTNLLPVEFVNERIIRAKKPWVLASVSLLMLGMLFSYFFVNQRWWGVNEKYARDGVSWKDAVAQVDQKSSLSFGFKDEDEKQTIKLNRINAISSELSEASETQSAWPEFLSALDQVLPRDPRLVNPDGSMTMIANPDQIPFSDREEIYVEYVESMYVDDVQGWLESALEPFRIQQGLDLGKRKKKKVVATEYDVAGSSAFVVEIKAHHFYNSLKVYEQSLHGSAFVASEVIDPLINGTIKMLNSRGEMDEYKMADIGVYYPTLSWESEEIQDYEVANPNYGREGREKSDDENSGDRNESPTGGEGEGESEGDVATSEVPKTFKVRRYEFKIQMIFIPTSPADRDAAKAQRLLDDAKDAAEAAKNPEQDTPEDEPETTDPAADADEKTPAADADTAEPGDAQPAAPDDAATTDDGATTDETPAEGDPEKDVAEDAAAKDGKP